MTPRSDALQQRIINFGIAACEIARRLPKDPAGLNLARQLTRSAMSPAGNYAEAREAESSHDYAHKMKLCVKEMRETAAWLAMAKKLARGSRDIDAVIKECDELTAIFVTCLKKARLRTSNEQAAKTSNDQASMRGTERGVKG